MVSRAHLSLKYSNGLIEVTDLNSSSGTFRNGTRIMGKSAATSGDEIMAGKTRIFVVSANGKATKAIKQDFIIEELGHLKGTWISNFFLKEIIGIGKTGLVFEAFDEAKVRNVAIKVFSKMYTDNHQRREQFTKGMKAVSKLQHPNLVRLLQAGKNADDFFYIAMQLVQGKSIDGLVNNEGIEKMVDWKEVWNCAYNIGTVLTVFFENDIVHRNVLPRNIIRRDRDGEYLLGDFSRATPINPDQKGWKGWRGKEFVSELHYLPPERIQDETGRIQDTLGNFPVRGATDIRSDIFGLGATCYAMLTGKPPATGAGLSELFEDIRSGNPPLPTDSHLAVSEQFQGVVMKMIAKNPTSRFQTPQDLLRDLIRVGRLSGLGF